VSTRERILDAAAEVIGSQGLARATTKEIARAADLSEAMLYKHFENKQELFLRVLLERLPSLSGVMAELPSCVGRGSVRGNLEDVAAAAIEFYAAGFPMAVSMFSEVSVLAAFQEYLAEHGAGPHQPVFAVARYIEAEREVGRVRPEVDPPAVAALLMGACFHRALLLYFTDEPPAGRDGRAVPEALVNALCAPVLIEAAPTS
jgi:AcrR family transcriptional regulator